MRSLIYVIMIPIVCLYRDNLSDKVEVYSAKKWPIYEISHFLLSAFTSLFIRALECRSWRVALVANPLGLEVLGADRASDEPYHDGIRR